MAQMRDVRSVWRMLSLAAIGLGVTFAACGPAPAPTTTVGQGASLRATPVAGARVIKYADEMIDVDKFPEPDVKTAGGIPPEDLTATPKHGGTLKLGFAVGRNDPHFPASTASGFLHRWWADGLLYWEPKCGCPQPELAESWTVGPDSMYYDFKIRKGIKFLNLPPVNGREITVQDIKWSMDRVSGLEQRPGRQGVFYRKFDNVKEFKILDDSTLRMVMKQPDVQVLYEVMHDYMTVLPKEAGGPEDTYEMLQTLIGSGPFITEYSEPGGQYRGRRNPDYWRKDKDGRQLPYVDRVETLAVSDQAAILAAFKTKQIDLGILRVNTGQLLMEDPKVRWHTGKGLTNGAIGLFMNTTIPPFNDIRVRRAVNLALDRKEHNVAAYGCHECGVVVNHMGNWEPWHWSEEKVWSLPGFARTPEAKKAEREEAKKLLAEAGYPNGIKGLEYWEPSPGPLFEHLSPQLAAVGIEISLKTVSGSTNRYATFMKDKTMSYAINGGGQIADYAVTAAWLCNAVQNMSLYCNPEVDKLHFAQRRERDQDKRVEIFQKIQQILWDDMPMAPLARPVHVHLSYKYVRGWRNVWYDLGFSNGANVWRVWLDK